MRVLIKPLSKLNITMLSESQVNTIMKDIFLIKRARKLMQQSRPLPIDTVMQLNILERQLRVRVHNVLLDLVRSKQIKRTKFEGQFLLC